jgi:hypothetical protein
MPYLSRRALEGLRAYEYKPAGYTYLDKIHAPFYNCERPPNGERARARALVCARRRGLPAVAASPAARRRAPCPGPAAPVGAGCVERMPMWLAPNLITLTGTIGLIIAYCVSAWYSPDFAGGAWRPAAFRARGALLAAVAEGRRRSGWAGMGLRAARVAPSAAPPSRTHSRARPPPLGLPFERVCCGGIRPPGLPGRQAGAPDQVKLPTRPAV